MVKTPDGLWFGKFEVTQAQWRRVTGSRKSGGRAVDEGDDKPVVGVSAGEVSSFLSRLNAMEPVRKSGLSFRLPTADEWTTACRAGGTGAWPLGADGREGSLDAMAWYRARPRSGFDLADPLRPVGTKAPNAYGLYDMLGNAEEMTATTVRIDDRFAGTVQGNVWCGGGVNFRPRPEPIENDFLGPQDDGGMNFRDGCLARRSLEGPLNQGGFRLCAGGTASGVSAPAPSVWAPAVRQTPSAAPAPVPAPAPPSAPGGAPAPDSAAARARQQAIELINAGDLAGAQAFLDLARSLESGTPAPTAAQPSEPAPGTRKVVRVGAVEVALRWCPPGSFTMGSPSSEDGRFANETQHRVTLTKGFWLGETEVTQGLWKKVMGDNPSYFKSGDDYPVENVSWDMCQRFVEKLNSQASVAGFRWALPTEAQWEYACRAGATTALPNGKDIRILGENNAPALDDIAWYGGNSSVDWHGVNGYDVSGWSEKQYSGSKAGTHPVARKTANEWGLYDMIGNAWEWCADWYGSYPSGEVSDPTGASSGSYRVRRGGSWAGIASFCRSAYRIGNEPYLRHRALGFRVALVPVR